VPMLSCLASIYVLVKHIGLFSSNSDPRDRLS
jgi:hypothetical protein